MNNRRFITKWLLEIAKHIIKDEMKNRKRPFNDRRKRCDTQKVKKKELDFAQNASVLDD